jgi:hypothetical protein
MWKLVAILAASALVCGCVTKQTQIDAHAPALNSWVGAPIEEFLDTQGDPTKVIERVDYQIYVFDAHKMKRYSGDGRVCEPAMPGEYQHCSNSRPWTRIRIFRCRYELLVAEELINDWRMSGSLCRIVTVGHRPS